jgi:hypothetical protein
MRLHPMARAGRSHPEFLVVVDMRVDLLCGGPKCDLSSVVERINALSEKVRSKMAKTDVLTKLVNRWPASKIDDLMPWAYAAKRT